MKIKRTKRKRASLGKFLVVQWLELGSFTGMAWVQFLVLDPASHAVWPINK